MGSEFDQLVAAALARPPAGWDFSWVGELMWREGPPSDCRAVVEALGHGSPDLLCLGTGAGEWLASLGRRPARTVATEGWAPKVQLARERLQPLGVEVVGYRAIRDNLPQWETEPTLPFPDGAFHLSSSRHESFLAAEPVRVLCPGGRFVTQQVGGWNGLRRLLGLPAPTAAPATWSLAEAAGQVELAGLRIVASGQARTLTSCADVGALVWYLANLPWALPEFELAEYRERLLELHRRSKAAPIRFLEERFWLLALKPGLSAPGPGPS